MVCAVSLMKKISALVMLYWIDISEQACEDAAVKARIDAMHEKNLFKLKLMPCFEYHAA